MSNTTPPDDDVVDDMIAFAKGLTNDVDAIKKDKDATPEKKRFTQTLTRTAIGRAYYATFLTAFKYSGKTGYGNSNNEHTRVCACISNSSMKKKYESLKAKRVLSDYVYSPGNVPDARESVIIAEYLIREFRKIK